MSRRLPVRRLKLRSWLNNVYVNHETWNRNKLHKAALVWLNLKSKAGGGRNTPQNIGAGLYKPWGPVSATPQIWDHATKPTESASVERKKVFSGPCPDSSSQTTLSSSPPPSSLASLGSQSACQGERELGSTCFKLVHDFRCALGLSLQPRDVQSFGFGPFFLSLFSRKCLILLWQGCRQLSVGMFTGGTSF